MSDQGVPSDLICEAIRHRRLLEVAYRGVGRLVEPYSHGTSHDGREVLVAYQRAGGSSSGHGEGWKALHVDEVENLSMVDVSFVANQPGYRPGGQSKNLAHVHCCV